MHEHLAKHRLDRASIKGIGCGRVVTLRSFGIDTLADVTRPVVLAVSGVGPALTQSLMAFRASIERVFVFDPQQPVSPIKIGKIDQEFRKLTAMLRAGPADLAATARQCAADRERLEVDIERAIGAARVA
jgi:DNA-binding helix-hairpin-helix protein with protein kinase domain